jgi:hypothetical protein
MAFFWTELVTLAFWILGAGLVGGVSIFAVIMLAMYYGSVARFSALHALPAQGVAA